MRNALVVAAILALAVASFFAATSLGGDDPNPTPTIPVGKALNLGRRSFTIEAPMTRGQEVIDLYGWVRNRSDVAVKLEEIRILEGTGVPENGKLLDVFLVPVSFTTGGLYNTLPPVEGRKGKCVRAPIEPVADYILAPGEEAAIGLHVRALGLGTFRLDERDFIYEQSGQRYRQHDSSGFVGQVRKKLKKGLYADLTYAERTCPGVKILSPK